MTTYRFIPHVIESVFFEIQINERKTIIVGVVYPNTQPRADIDIFMQTIIEIQSIIKEEHKTAYLMGDFNIDLLKVNLLAKTNEFVNDVISHGFLPKITRPTRITPHSATLIDHIYSNDNRPTSQNDISGIIITDVADHFGTFNIVSKLLLFLNTTMYCEFKLMRTLYLFFWKQVLHEIYNWCITVVAFFREEVRHALVGSGHEIV